MMNNTYGIRSISIEKEELVGNSCSNNEKSARKCIHYAMNLSAMQPHLHKHVLCYDNDHTDRQVNMKKYCSLQIT